MSRHYTRFIVEIRQKITNKNKQLTSLVACIHLSHAPRSRLRLRLRRFGLFTD